MNRASSLKHSYDFDPSHGYSSADLLAVEAPPEPPDYLAFWHDRRQRALRSPVHVTLEDTGWEQGTWRVMQLRYRSTEDAVIHGWLLIPRLGEVRRGFVIGHGYAGRDAPDFDLPLANSALLFPVLRGMAKSPFPPASAEPRWHVLHHIDKRERYIFGGCVEDTWLAVSTLLRLYPQLAGHLGYLGISFGGGIGAMAMAFEERIARAHLNVPSFGHQRLRLKLPSVGSADSVQRFAQRHPTVTNTLDYFDAAIAARHIRMPMHCALAGFDPFVAPAGQYAIYNALAGPKTLFPLTAGHHAYPAQAEEDLQLRRALHDFFEPL